MKIINYKTPENSSVKEVNDYLISLNSKRSFIRVLSGKEQPLVFTSYGKRSISAFKKQFGLNIISDGDIPFYNTYIKLINNFIDYNEVSVHGIRAEVFGSVISVMNKKNTVKLLKDFENEQTLQLFNSKLFQVEVYELSKANETVEQVFDFLKKAIEESGVLEIKNQTKNVIKKHEASIKDLVEAIGVGMKYASSISEDITLNGDSYDEMSITQKVEWLKKYSADTSVVVIDAVGSTSKFLGADYNSIFNPEFTTLNKINEKYKSFVNSIVLNEQNCSIYKTLAYLAIFLGREKIECAPTEYMKKMINRDTRWATGSEVTQEPSFYGDSDIWKLIYGYAPFMRGEANPFREIIENRQVDDMDRQALLMHKWFNENGLSDLVYNLIYEKDLVGGQSLYEILGTAKDLIKLLEEPIVCSSALDNLTAAIKGIVSGMINTFVSTIDFSLATVARELFYKKFIPTGKPDGKISIAELHDYLAFISAILKQYENGAPTSVIDKESFVNKIYASISSGAYAFETSAYGAFDSKINSKNGIDIYEPHLEKVDVDEVFCLSRHVKSLHALVIFATQKESKKYGSSYVNTINYGNQHSVNSLIKKLTKPEIFFVLKTFGVNFLTMDKEFDKYTLKEIMEFDDTLRDAQLYNDMNYNSSGFYDSYVVYDKTVLSLEMRQEFFESSNYDKFINKGLSHFFAIVTKNKNNISKAILDSNNVSDVDDFLIRFLPSFNEIARTLGLNTGTIGHLIKAIDYICEFITTILFKKLYMDIKGYINDYVKAITDDLFTAIDEVGDKLGMSNGLVIKFEFGGRFISGKLESLMKVLDNFTLTSALLDKCFTDPNLDSVDLDAIIDNDFGFGDNTLESSFGKDEDFNINVDNDYEYGEDNDYGYDEDSYGKKPIPPEEEELKIKIEVEDKGFVEKVIEGTVGKKDPPKYITFEKGDITITTENNKKIVIVSKDDKKDNSFTITQDTYDKIESEIVSKDEIGQLIEIRDFVNNITNKVIIDIQDELNKTKNKIQAELDKAKPDNSKLKDLTKKEQDLVKELDSAKNKAGIKTNSITATNPTIVDEQDIVLHDYSNGDLNLNKLSAILGDLEEFTKNSKIPLTTAQIMELLK